MLNVSAWVTIKSKEIVTVSITPEVKDANTALQSLATFFQQIIALEHYKMKLSIIGYTSPDNNTTDDKSEIRKEEG